MHLVLFDIDGTLLNSHGAGRRAMKVALQAVYGTAGDLDGYDMAGKTDRRIIFDVLTAAGLTPAQVEAQFPAYRDAFARALAHIVQGRPPTPLPGAHHLVERLARRSDIVLGLLTGNLPEGARIKLVSAGFDPDLFPVTAFGSEALDREDLPPIAVDRAHRLTNHRFAGKRIVIVGDTPLDIRCSKVIAAKSVAVATGPYPVHELARHAPDVVLPNLADVDQAEAAILDGARTQSTG